MDREDIGDDVVEDQRFLADDRVTGQKPHDPVALLEALEVGRQALEPRTVRGCAAELVKLNYGRERADTVIESMMKALEGLIHDVEPFDDAFLRPEGAGRLVLRHAFLVL